MKAFLITAIASLALLTTGCMAQNQKEAEGKNCKPFFQKVN